MDAVSQFHNKCRNLLSGIAKSSAKYYCALCDANSDGLHQLSRPRTTHFTTRTAQSKPLNLLNQPLYDICTQKHDDVTLHNMKEI